jgi:FlaA1/EpsC-like NDP-sugar epimerase
MIIFGGTGTLGKALVKEVYGKHHTIHIVSRDEIKQAEMKEEFPKCEYHLGDVTNPYSLPYIPNPGPVFNLAAMKHVERGQKHHEYCVNVNYNGVINTYSWAHTHKATSYTQSSTDKAIEPVNTYGKAKSLAEDYLLSRNKQFPISIFNWGNIAGSRGSVLQKFIKTLHEEKTLYITDFNMTRFWLTIEEVAKFMWKNHETQGYHVPPMKGAKVIDFGLALAVFLGFQPKDIKLVETGNRGGEKLHEKLAGNYSNKCEQYSQKELLNLIERVLK